MSNCDQPSNHSGIGNPFSDRLIGPNSASGSSDQTRWSLTNNNNNTTCLTSCSSGSSFLAHIGSVSMANTDYLNHNEIGSSVTHLSHPTNTNSNNNNNNNGHMVISICILFYLRFLLFYLQAVPPKLACTYSYELDIELG